MTEQTDPDKIAGHHRDARMSLTLSDNNLEAFAEFSPSIGGGKPLTVEYAEKVFSARGIERGIDWDTVKESIFTCNTEHKPQAGIHVASGQPPKQEIPAHFEIVPELLIHAPPPEKGGRIDHKLVSPFIMVKKEQVLAQKYEFVPGEEGVGLTGEPVPFGKKEISPVLPGEGTYTDDENNVKASLSGRFTLIHDVFTVSPVLDVKGNVDYHTGHIIFPGDIVISGEIKAGFHVYAGGSLLCNETIEAEDITAKKQIIAKMGILGRENGMVRAGESIQAKFIQHCIVKCRKGVYVQDSALNAFVKTMDTFTTGDHGKIIGGEILAVNGVTAAQIGNEAFHHTYIQCGIDFAAKKELEKVKQKNIALYLKKQSIEELLERGGSHDLKQVLRKITEYLNKLTEKMDYLLTRINKNEDAVITVTDTIYPGTTLDICHTDFFIEKPMKRVRFKLDKTVGEIVSEEL